MYILCSYLHYPRLTGPDLMRNWGALGSFAYRNDVSLKPRLILCRRSVFVVVWAIISKHDNASTEHLALNLDVLIYIDLWVCSEVLVLSERILTYSELIRSPPSPGCPCDRHLLEFRWCIGQLRCTSSEPLIHLCHECHVESWNVNCDKMCLCQKCLINHWSFLALIVPQNWKLEA